MYFSVKCMKINDYIFIVIVILWFTTLSNEPRREKTGLRNFRPDLTQTNLYSHRKELEA